MRITIINSARKHGITDEEIRNVVSFPMARYRIRSRRDPTARVFRILGAEDHGPDIEVIAEELGDEMQVLHAMLLTGAIAKEARAEAYGLENFRGRVVNIQRRHEGGS